jgi:methylmalonyl-CoA mutase
MSEKLFEEFPPVPTEVWEDLIQQDLKGADYEKKLVWNTYENINLRPYYRAEDIANLNYLTQALPGEFPYTRGNKRSTNRWEIRQNFENNNPEEANRHAKRSIERGVDGVGFNLETPDAQTLQTLLNGIDLSAVQIHLSSFVGGAKAYNLLSDYLKQNGIQNACGSIESDAIAALVVAGSGPAKSEILSEAANLAKLATQQTPGIRTTCVDLRPYQMAGSNISQEIALALATGVEYVDAMQNAGLNEQQISASLQFIFPVGSSYFLEIARLRAFRFLWARVCEAFGFKPENSKAFIHSETSLWNKTIYDPNVNMLRSTTEAMSAVMGGCDSLEVLPFDSVYTEAGDFSYRIARNTQIILKEEALFEKIVDPAAGSYYIETITDKLIESGYKEFQQIESEGGIIDALIKGSVQKAIKTTAANRNKMLTSRRDSILGTNQYPNLSETMLNKVTRIKKTIQTSAQVLSVEPLNGNRASQAYEDLRLRTEASKITPKVFLWTAGSLTFRKARANFVTNLFGCGGYQIIDNPGFKTAAEGLAELKKHNPQIVVLCSSDEQYAELAAEVFPLLQQHNSSIIKIIAGMPANSEELKALGADDFVHVKTNAIECLKLYSDKLGV